VKQHRSRTAVAALMTLIVVSLLTLSAASNNRTKGYYPFAEGDRSARRDNNDQVEIDPSTPFEVKVRATLHEAPADAPDTVPVKVMSTDGGVAPFERQDELRKIESATGHQFGVGCSAILFALFGLFVLWWGRDRASLWLGLFCVSFAPGIYNPYSVLPDWGVLLCKCLADGLFFLSLYAFFEIARTFAVAAMSPADPLCRRIETLRELALATVVFAAAVNFAETVGPTVFGENVSGWLATLGTFAKNVAIVGVLAVGPIVLLAISLWRAVDDSARSRVRVTLITTLAAESGVLVASWSELSSGHRIGFNNWWYTLLAIPIGFALSIPAYKVVEVKFVLNRILVLTTMTAVIGAIIALTETWADNVMKERVPGMVLQWLDVTSAADKTHFVEALRFAVAFAIVLSFSRFHHVLDGFFTALFFRHRDEGVRSLHDFAANRAQFITGREDMLEQAAALVCGTMGACGAAFYEESAASYLRATSSGAVVWPAGIGENDPAFVAMRGGRGRLDLVELELTPSLLGVQGVAFRMAVCDRVVGALVVGARLKESEGPYGPEELAVLEEVTRSVADALFNLRANETADFVRGVAEGALQGNDAVERAEVLCVRGLPGIDTSLQGRTARSHPPPQQAVQAPRKAQPPPREDATVSV
jgi:hypothetical protein